MLEVENIRKSYGGRQVLQPVSFQVAEGEALGVAGPNGSGKSTLLSLLAQVQRPDGGQLRFGGRSVLGDRRFLRRQLGYVPQRQTLATELTVRQQLRLWQAACGRSGPLPEGLLEGLGLAELLGRPIAQLSGGTRQRVSIAMALLTGPSLLVMDEATAGLDDVYVQRLLGWMEDFLRRGGVLIWCTHRPEEFRRLCRRLLRLEEGLARWDGAGPAGSEPQKTQGGS